MKLGDVLKDLDIDIPAGEGDKGGEGNKGEEFKVEDLPEEHREKVQAAIDAGKGKIGELETTIAQKDMTIKSIQESFEKASGEGKKVDEGKKEGGEKLFGVSDETDYYNPAFTKIAEKLERLETAITEKDTGSFMSDLEGFTTKNPDIVRYADDMDRIANVHPTLLKDIPKLYALGKEVHNRRAEKEEKARKLAERTEGAAVKGSEISGTSTGTVSPGQVKTISEAFEQAQTSMSKT